MGVRGGVIFCGTSRCRGRAAWPSGLGRGLQSPVRGFDSHRRLQGVCPNAGSSGTRLTMASMLSMRPMLVPMNNRSNTKPKCSNPSLPVWAAAPPPATHQGYCEGSSTPVDRKGWHGRNQYATRWAGTGFSTSGSQGCRYGGCGGCCRCRRGCSNGGDCQRIVAVDRTVRSAWTAHDTTQLPGGHC